MEYAHYCCRKAIVKGKHANQTTIGCIEDKTKDRMQILVRGNLEIELNKLFCSKNNLKKFCRYY